MELPRHHELTELLRALATGAAVDDRDLDRLFPKEARGLARLHWTPVAVARAAAAFLTRRPGDRLLDVGAGAGKFSLVAALTTRAEITAIEHDGELAEIAAGLVKLHKVPRLRIVAGDAFAADWTRFQGLYFYNPFTGGDEPAFVAAVAATTERLSGLAAGTRVALFHGFGGPMPKDWRRVDADEIAHLTLWEKSG